MSHSMGSNATTAMTMCEMSMLWNWQTVDTCILAEGWHVTGKGMFAATCVGVALMAVVFEALRKFCKDYDHLVARQLAELSQTRLVSDDQGGLDTESLGPWFSASYNHGPRRATPFQQLVRTILHVLAAGVGYLLMLVIMSFNGYVFISILIGTGIGKFFCDWMTVGHDAGYSPCPHEPQHALDEKAPAVNAHESADCHVALVIPGTNSEPSSSSGEMTPRLI